MSALNPIGTAAAQEIDPEEENRGLAEESSDPTQPIRTARYYSAMNALREIDPKNPELVTLTAPNYVPSETDVGRVELAAKVASLKRVRDYVMPGGELIGDPGKKYEIREMSGGLPAAQRAFDHLSAGGTLLPFGKGANARLPGDAGFITLRPTSSTPGSPAVNINVPGVPVKKLHY